MICGICGSKNDEDSKFCCNCGASFENKVETDETQEVVAANPEGKHNKVIIACVSIIAIVVIAVAGLFIWKAFSGNVLTLDKSIVSDDVVRTTLIEKYDHNKDNKLTQDELDEVQSLELDSGNDYSYLKYFSNLGSVVVNNSEVGSIDLSENKNLKEADFRGATNITDIKLPEMISYDYIQLPSKEGLNVELPSNSDYEVKFVPKKIEETYTSTEGNGHNFEKITYEQEVESATKIKQLTTQTEGENSITVTYKYDDSGRISSYGRNSSYGANIKLSYNDNNQVSGESTSAMGSTNVWREATYDGQGNITKVNSTAYDRTETTEIKLDNGEITYIESDDSKVRGFWKNEGNNLKSCYMYSIPSPSGYVATDYVWNNNRPSSLELSWINFDRDKPTTTSDFESPNAKVSHDVTFQYENDRLVKATYNNGFVHSFSYDTYGNLINVTSEGLPSISDLEFTMDCSIEYVQVIGKKGSEALNFLQLPGLSKKNLFNHKVSIRPITLRGIGYANNPFSQDFSGKYWWDEENIISSQVEAANARKQISSSSDVTSVEAEEHSIEVQPPNSTEFSGEQNQTIEYDLLKNPNNNEALEKINTAIAETIRICSDQVFTVSNNRGVITTRSLKVSYSNDEIVCFRDSSSRYAIGAAHPGTDRAEVAYSLKTGERVDVLEYFGLNNSNGLSLVKNAVVSFLKKNPEDSDCDSTLSGTRYTPAEVADRAKIELEYPYGTKLDGATKLAVTEKGLVYLTEQYELGSYAYGVRDIIVVPANDNYKSGDLA